MEKIAIFPASGGIGGGTYRHLLNLVDPKKVILIARHPDKVEQNYKDAGVTVRYGDYDKPETLEHAFEGARYLNLISYASIEHEHRFKVHKHAITHALSSGVKHIFYSSLGFANHKPNSLESRAFVMQAHLDTEKYLAKLAKEKDGFTYTIIRQGLYTESYGLYLAFLDLKNPPAEVKIPHDGTGPGISWVKRDELGEGTAHLIADYMENPSAFPYTNATILLSGPKEISLKESVEIIGRVVGKEIKVKEVSVDEWAEQDSVREASKYLAGEMKKPWATAWAAVRRGEACQVTDHLKKLLGREPEGFEETIRDMAKA